MVNLCINARCPHPDNSETQLFCQSCGSELLLAGRYRVLTELGSGGFGKTYEVMATHQTEIMVLKVLINPQPKAVELFQREAQVLGQLKHPGIPKVDSDGYFTYFPRDAQEPMHCLVMEKIEGMDLAEYMEHRGHRPIDVSTAIRWLEEIVLILDVVHRQQFFHRDIKPANIMLRSSGALALIDFGTVRQISATYVAKQGLGQVTGVVSAGYTAPEQLNGQAVLQSDFYALGRTFVFLLTGKEPVDLYDPFQDAVVWRDFTSDLSSDFANLIDRMMARSLSERPQSAQELLTQLADLKNALMPEPAGLPVTLDTSPESSSIRVHENHWTRRFNRKFLLQWVAVTVIAEMIGVLVPIYAPEWGLEPSLPREVFAVLIGGGQWLVLRQKVRPSMVWIVSIVVPLLLANVLIAPTVQLYRWLRIVVTALLLGVIQSWVVRHQARRYGWWVLIGGGVYLFFQPIPWILFKTLTESAIEYDGAFQSYLFLRFILELLKAIALGVGLLWLFNSSKVEAQTE